MTCKSIIIIIIIMRRTKFSPSGDELLLSTVESSQSQLDILLLDCLHFYFKSLERESRDYIEPRKRERERERGRENMFLEFSTQRSTFHVQFLLCSIWTTSKNERRTRMTWQWNRHTHRNINKAWTWRFV